MAFVAIFFSLILFAGLVLIIADTIRGKGRFGINFKIPNCPTCGKKLPAVRVPKSLRQAMWGGATCEFCQTEVDKWGEIVNLKRESRNSSQQIEQAKTEFVTSFDDKGKTPLERIFEE